MKKVSTKRKATSKLMHNSTFSRKPKKAKEVITVEQMKERGLVAKAKNVHDRGYWKRQADKWFSEFIRLRDSGPDGRGKCVTCSHTGHWRQLQNGHWITRGHEATRYDERNCSMQCRGCNYNGGQHLKHAAALRLRYGQEVTNELEQKAKRPCRRQLADYKFLSDTYKARVQWIKEHEPEKYTQEKF